MVRALTDNALAWYYRRRPRAFHQRLWEISVTEDDSAWHALRGFYETENDQIRAMFLALYIEEQAHAEWFRELIKNQTEHRTVTGSRFEVAESISQEDLKTFLEFQIAGEHAAIEAHKSYLSYSRAYPRAKAVFEKVAQDEAAHVSRIETQLRKLSTAHSLAEYRRISGKNVFKRIESILKKLNGVFLTAWLVTLYFIFGSLITITNIGKRGKG